MRDSNPQPTDYESAVLTSKYKEKDKIQGQTVEA